MGCTVCMIVKIEKTETRLPSIIELFYEKGYREKNISKKSEKTDYTKRHFLCMKTHGYVRNKKV